MIKPSGGHRPELDGGRGFRLQVVIALLENRRLKKQLASDHRFSELLNISGTFTSDFRRLTNSTLGKAFSLDQLGMIEAAFEADYQGCWGNAERWTQF